MIYIKTTFFFLFSLNLFGQTKTPEDFGFRHFETSYLGDKVDILVKSSEGQEYQKKPVFLFCQGSLPQPLIKFDGEGVYGVFPFNPDILTLDYHVVIVSKPYVPLIADISTLGDNFTFVDSTGQFPKKYIERNYLDYYVDRNIEVIKFLQEQNWVSKNQLVIAGHSEGSTVASKMASKSPLITHLIYSGGNPMGRIMSILQESRAIETGTDSTSYGERQFQYWQKVVENNNSLDTSQGDTFKATFEFSIPPLEYLENLNIPVLISYGTKDWSAPFNDFLRVDMIRRGKKNFTFKAYIGAEHNYFPLTSANEPDYDIFNWDRVVRDWEKWLGEN